MLSLVVLVSLVRISPAHSSNSFGKKGGGVTLSCTMASIHKSVSNGFAWSEDPAFD